MYSLKKEKKRKIDHKKQNKKFFFFKNIGPFTFFSFSFLDGKTEKAIGKEIV